MKSFHNFNSFQSPRGAEPQSDHESSSSTTTYSPTLQKSSLIASNCKMPAKSTLNALNCNSGSRSIFMDNNHNNFLLIPDAISAPPSPSVQAQSFNLSSSSSTPPSPILTNKISTGYVSNNNEYEFSVKIVETDPLEKRYVMYRVEVTIEGQKWFVRRRYSEFHHLLEAVCTYNSV